MIFDIDWTIVYPLKGDVVVDNINVIMADGEPYRLTTWTQEVLHRLSQKPDLRISFYSGGNATRNAELLKAIILPDGKSAYDIAYKILNKEDLVVVSTDPTLPFTKRFNKDVSKVQPDLRRVIHVDDSFKFTLPGQERNQVWLGETYNFYENFEDIPEHPTRFDPPNFQAWEHEKHKLISVYEMIEKVHAKRDEVNPLLYLPTHLPTTSGTCNFLLK